MKKHKKAIPSESELIDLQNRLNNGRCNIRKLEKELYGDTRDRHLYAVLRGACYDPEALSHLKRLAETGNVEENQKITGRRKKDHSKYKKCKCPKCGELYNRNAADLNWTNPLIEIPRIYCDSCLLAISPPGGNREDWESFEEQREEEFKRHDTHNGLWSEL